MLNPFPKLKIIDPFTRLMHRTSFHSILGRKKTKKKAKHWTRVFRICSLMHNHFSRVCLVEKEVDKSDRQGVWVGASDEQDKTGCFIQTQRVVNPVLLLEQLSESTFCSTSLAYASTGFMDPCFVQDGFVWLTLSTD